MMRFIGLCAVVVTSSGPSGSGCARRPAGPARTSGTEVIDAPPQAPPLDTDEPAPPPPTDTPPAPPAAWRLVGIISPHAGYEYSGAVAGWCWSLLRAPTSSQPAERAGSPEGTGSDAAAFPAQVAGQFYPGGPDELRRAVERFLAGAGTRTDIVAGDVATIVVLAPSHHWDLPKIALPASDSFRTPLGDVAVDTALRARLLDELPDDVERNDDAFLREHAMEDQLPFVQVVRPGVKVLPVIVGASDLGRLERFGAALGRAVRDRPDVAIAASSDLSHFYTYDEAVAYDEETLAALENGDLARYDEIGPARRGMCGYYAVRAALAALAEIAGADGKAIRLRYANSGDVTGDRSRVVGYGALALVAPAAPVGVGAGPPPQEDPEGTTMYTREERQALIDMAKASVRAAVTGEPYDPDPPASEALRREGAAFVTLREHGNLRGCIGHIIATVPLYRCVVEVARSAAVEDYRFSPVGAGELPDLTYEVSVLTPPEPVDDPSTVTVGRDGLIISRGGRRGLLLPQVPGEQGWDRDQFLDGTCRKAGLPAGCWREPDTRIERFHAVVWGEDLEDIMP